MDACCICFSSKRSSRLQQLSELDPLTSISYSAMIFFLTDVKINEDNTKTICRLCVNHLRAAYDFKKKIVESDLVLSNCVNKERSKVYFNTIEELKKILQINDDELKPTTSVLADNFKSALLSNNVTTERIILPRREIYEKKPIPILDFLSIIEEDIDANLDYDMDENTVSDRSEDDYSVPLAERLNKQRNEKRQHLFKNGFKKSGPDEESDPDYDMAFSDNGSDDDYLLIEKLKKQKTKKRKFKKLYDRSTQNKTKSHKICIKPVVMRNLETLKTKAILKKKREKKAGAKNKVEVCPYCGITVRVLKTHLRLHTAQKDFLCSKCDKKFYSQQDLLRHEKKVHLYGKQFKCKECSAAFNSKSGLQSHMSVHSEEKNYVCSLCAKAFKRRNHLLRHVKMHSSANQTVSCEECKLSFFDKSRLKHHMRVHTGERPYCCEICHQPYSYKHDFTTHCLKKHGVFLKRRKVNIMNEHVLQKEKVITKELIAMARGKMSHNIREHEEFQGPGGVLALNIAMKYLKRDDVLKYFL